MKRSLKVVSLFLIVSQLFAMCAYASVVTGVGDGTDSGYYWYENFNDYTDGTSAPESITIPSTQTNITSASYAVSEANGNYAYQVGNKAKSNTSSHYFKIVGDKPLDFSKGPIVLSYDMTPTASTTKIRGELIENASSSILAQFAYLNSNNNGKIQGYKLNDAGTGLTPSNSTITIAANTKYTITVLLDYDSSTKALYCKQFVNGVPMVDSTGNTFEYTRTLSDTLATRLESNIWSFRFYVYGGSSVIIDNVTVFTEGKPSLPEAISWVQNGKGTGISFANAVSYGSGVSLPCPYPFPASPITSANQYELKKYDIISDPLMLSGTAVSSTVSWSGATGFTVSGLDVTNKTYDLYVLKLNDPEVIENYSGVKNANQYIILHGGVTNVPVIRESALYSGAEPIGLGADGKLPVAADKLEITVANSAEITASNVTFSGNGKTATATQDGKTFTLNLPELAEGTKYTVTVGDTVAELTTTGTAAASGAFGYAEKFDDSTAISGMKISDTTNVTVSHDSGKLLWKNAVSGSSATQYAALEAGSPFDFSKGAMYVSFDVEANQNITWSGTNNPLFTPELRIGSRIAGYIPGIESYGIRGRNSSGGRVKTNHSLSDSMKVGDKFNAGLLITYYPDKTEGNIGFIQFADGERLCAENGDVIPEYYMTFTDEELQNVPSIRFYGRNISEGLYFDNVVITTVDKITADDTIVLNGTNATINIKNSVEFEEGTDELITQPLYTNSLTKTDVKVTKYASTDNLLLNGTAVTDFRFDSDSLTVSNLQNSSNDVFVIEIDNTKLTSYSGEAVDKKYFKADASAPQGLIKTAVYDASEKEMYCEDGLVSTAAAKIAFTFADGYVTSGVALGSTNAVFENGAYVVTLSVPLAANSNYTLKVDGSDYGTFKTTDGAISVSVPTIRDDSKASVVIINTTSKSVDVYLLNAAFNADKELVNFVYDKITVDPGTTENFTSEKALDTTGASTQKAFVWDGFEKLTPYNDFFEKTLN